MKRNFQEKRHLYTNYVFYILNFYRKCLLFRFLGYSKRMQIFILTVVWKRHIGRYKNGHILLKMYFWSLLSKMKVTCLLIVSFISFLFNINIFFSVLKLRHMNMWMHIPIVTEAQNGCIICLKKRSDLDTRTFFCILIFRDEVTCMAIVCFIFWRFYRKLLLFLFFSRAIYMKVSIRSSKWTRKSLRKQS